MVTMRTPSFLRSLSSKFSMSRRSVSVVVPMVEDSLFSQHVVSALDRLQSSEHDVGCASWVADVLDATTVTQKLAYEFLTHGKYLNVNKELIDEYLYDNVELLDACNSLVEKMDMIQKYVTTLKATTRLLDINVVTSPRVQDMLNECNKLEKECASLDKSSPKLCKLIGRKANQSSHALDGKQDLEFNELVSMSKEVALVTCHRLQKAFSFKSKRSLMKIKSDISTNWSNSLNGSRGIVEEETERRKKCTSNSMMYELEEVMRSSKALQDEVKSHKIYCDLDLARSSCEALEEGMKPLEEKVRELYKNLISIRMVLLDILSQS